MGLVLGSFAGLAAAERGGHDADGDGLGDAAERSLDTDLRSADTDRDGVPDGPERRWSANPAVADTDGDGLTDGVEASLGTDPVNPAASGLLTAGLFGFAAGLFALGGWRRMRSESALSSPSRAESTAIDAAPVVSEPDPLSEAEGDAIAAADVILTNRERVRRLLAANGGRVKQRRIVEVTGWSKSKVSECLSEMEADGAITRVRAGRQNVVCLPGREPEVADWPFEERN